MLAIHPLDLDLIRDFGERARALFDAVTLRAYAASVIGRAVQRMPFGAHREFPLQVGTTRIVANNDSKTRVLLVYVDLPSLIPVAVVYSPSQDSGTINFETIQNQGAGVPPSTFVLRPSEQLFARAFLPATVVVATEWY